MRRGLRRRGADGPPAARPLGVAAIDVNLSRVFVAPRWLRGLGRISWLLVGVGVVLVGLVWVLGITSTIVEPVVVGGVVAAVASPGVGLARPPSRPARGGLPP